MASKSVLRSRKARRDATLASVTRSIEACFGLPAGSIRVVNPDGRKARSDKTVEALRRDYGAWS